MLHVGRLGMMRTAEGSLHYYINGEDQGLAIDGVPTGVYAVIDLYGVCGQVRARTISLLARYGDSVGVRAIVEKERRRIWIRIFNMRIRITEFVAAVKEVKCFRHHPTKTINSRIVRKTQSWKRDEHLN